MAGSDRIVKWCWRSLFGKRLHKWLHFRHLGRGINGRRGGYLANPCEMTKDDVAWLRSVAKEGR